MKNRYSKLTLIVSCLMALFPVNVFADSSWVWISEKRPFDILPWVALGTILIEWLSIWLIPKTGNAFKVLGIVIVANAASFLLPYAFLKADLSWYGTFEHILDSGPHYIVSGVFLMLTIIIIVRLSGERHQWGHENIPAVFRLFLPPANLILQR